MIPNDSLPAIITAVGERPNIYDATVWDLRRGGCSAAINGPVNTGDEGVLSIKVAGGYVSRPVYVAKRLDDETVALAFTPMPFTDARWAHLVDDDHPS